jgi:hypothetical protein
MQAVSSEQKDFGQPVFSSSQPGVLDSGARDGLLTPAQAAACFHIPEYLLAKPAPRGARAPAGVNALWISPAAVAAFARAWRAKKGPNS